VSGVGLGFELVYGRFAHGGNVRPRNEI
jgi:hypothetical protein